MKNFNWTPPYITTKVKRVTVLDAMAIESPQIESIEPIKSSDEFHGNEERFNKNIKDHGHV